MKLLELIIIFKSYFKKTIEGEIQGGSRVGGSYTNLLPEPKWNFN